MTKEGNKLLVIGHGADGLSAALAAAEAVRDRRLPLEITLLEKASHAEAGANTRWSPSYMRMAAVDRAAPDFEQDVQLASSGRADQVYFHTLAEHAPGTNAWLREQGIEFSTPVYYLSAGPPRIQPNGGGRAIVERLSKAAFQVGVQILSDCAAMRATSGERRRYALKTTGSRRGPNH